MNEPKHIIQLRFRAWGCKIKSKIKAELTTEQTELEQGDDLNLKLKIEFDPEDLPTNYDLGFDPEQKSSGFVFESPIRDDILGSDLVLDIPLKFVDAEVGEYIVELNFRQAEFGTRLAEVSPIVFQLTTPEVELVNCRTNRTRLSKGQEFIVQLAMNSPAPQKLRGIVFGRLISNDRLKYKMYELEPKRISIHGEKELAWHLKIPIDETKTGRFKAIIEFKSKDTFSKKEFDDFLEVRQNKLLRVNSLTGSSEFLSVDDELEINAEIENIGLEELKLDVYPEVVRVSTEKSANNFGKDTGPRWSLPVKTLMLIPDAKETLNWSWSVPKEGVKGKYLVNFHWKDQLTGAIDSYSKELFEIKSHHELKIVNVFSINESYGPADEAQVKIILSDTGTRAGEKLEIECKIFDIFNQEVYKKITEIGIASSSLEHDFVWSVPAEIDGGKYDIVIRLIQNDEVLLSQKFSKLLNIELPVRLDLHLVVPTISKPNLEFTRYLLENEKILKKIDYNNLTIYRLSSNTHIYLLDGELITYSKDRSSTPAKLQGFIDALFGYYITKQHLMTKKINEELEFWGRLGYSWISLVRNGGEWLNLPKTFNEKTGIDKKITLSTWEDHAQRLFKSVFIQKSKEPLKLNKIFTMKQLKNKDISATSDFKLISSTLRYLAEYNTTTPSASAVTSKQQKLKKESKNIQQLSGLRELLATASKFRRVPNSKQLQNKFNKLISRWIADSKSGHVRRTPDKSRYLALNAGYSYLLLYLVDQITLILESVKRKKYITPTKFNKLILFEMLYYFVQANYYRSQARYDPAISSRSGGASSSAEETAEKKKKGKAVHDDTQSIADELGRALGEIKKASKKYWYFHILWQNRYGNYLKNMSKRTNLAFVHEHVKIATNPIILHGMRGGKSNGKLILGNNGPHAIALHPYLALPSQHWSMAEPEAHLINNLYNLKRIIIPPKQTKEIPISITFPRSLSFSDYAAVLKLNPKSFKLLPEL